MISFEYGYVLTAMSSDHCFSKCIKSTPLVRAFKSVPSSVTLLAIYCHNQHCPISGPAPYTMEVVRFRPLKMHVVFFYVKILNIVEPVMIHSEGTGKDRDQCPY